ncbi:ATP-binding protein [Paenibacillus oryzisoli]|uniref:AAA family ATPase n=1 Tax=Paenibacillus oryzisoli TaxID=1850517 RepID=UPI003D2CEED4
MKATMVVKLIEAHSSGSEKAFEDAVQRLAKDEEKKGNHSLANSLVQAYRPAPSSKNSLGTGATLAPSSFEASNYGAKAYVIPKDKDTSLDLYEVMSPTSSMKDIILSPDQRKIIGNVIKEQENSKKLVEKGFQPTNRLLLCGPPGCGKTLTANVIAHELGLPLVYVRLDGLISSYLGQTSANIRKIFDSVKQQEVVLFLDEFDAIAKKRDDQHELGELKRVVNTLLQNFDSLPSHVLLIAATNHHHLLDPAIWRRFDISVELELPNIEQRKQFILSVFEKHEIQCDLDLHIISQAFGGLSGSQIKTIIEQTIKESFIEGKGVVTEDDVLRKFLNTTTMNTFNHSDNWKTSAEMLYKKGIPQKIISRILNVPKSTLSDFLKESAADV